jgi:plasmid stabilization system protein ParE
MNPDFRVLPEVADDIFEIWRFIAEDNVEAANRVEQEIWDAFSEPAVSPNGRSRLTNDTLMAVSCSRTGGRVITANPKDVAKIVECRKLDWATEWIFRSLVVQFWSKCVYSKTRT